MSSKKKTKTTQKTILDPLTQQLSEMRLGQEKQFLPVRQKAVSGLESMLYGSPFGDTGQPLTGVLPGLSSAFKRGFEQDILPGLAAQLTAGGMGRGGAVGEQARKAGVSAQLPLQEMQLRTLMGLADPSGMMFAQAPTNVQTTTQKSSGVGSWLGAGLGLLAAPFTGGSSLAGSLFSGGQGTSSGWQAPSWGYNPMPNSYFYPSPYRG